MTSVLESKINKSILEKFFENTELLKYTVFQRLFGLLKKLNKGNDIIDDIGKKYNSDFNRKIISDELEEKIKKDNELLNDYNEIINYLNNIPYIENLDNLDESFLERYDSYLEIINEPKNYEEYEFDDGILFMEELKNNFRGRNKQAFEYYNKLQENIIKF